MARFRKGVLGGFSGKVGTVIGGNWKGIDYMRSLSAAGKHQPTTAQLGQHIKFALAIRFIQSMSGLVSSTFKNFANKMTEFNSAVSYTLKNAITGTYPSFAINYANVLVSRGDLPNAAAPSMAAAGGGNIKFTWSNNSGTGIAASDDHAVLVAYEPVSNTTVYSTNSAGRNAETGTLSVAQFTGKTVHTYLGFISNDGKETSVSIYTGEVVVA